MRCRYCGKELALLKRLTGGGEFCSDAHKQSYQDEYNRLALSRLLQAQKKGQKTNSPAAPSAPPPRNASGLGRTCAGGAGRDSRSSGRRRMTASPESVAAALPSIQPSPEVEGNTEVEADVEAVVDG